MWIISIDSLIALIFSVSVIAAVGCAWVYDFLDERSFAQHSSINLFYCLKCNNIYSLKDDLKYAVCPNCKTKNLNQSEYR